MKLVLCRSALVLILLFLVSCDKEVSTPATKLFTFTFDERVRAGTGHIWVVATNENGEVLDFSEIRENLHVELLTTKSFNQVDLTIFESNNSYFVLNTYRDVDPAREIKFISPPPARVVTTMGISKYRVENYSGNSPGTDIRFFNPDGGNYTGTSFINGVYETQQHLYASSSKVLLLTRKGEIPVYGSAIATPNSTLTFDVNALKPYENLLALNYPGYTNVFASDEKGYGVTLMYSATTPDQPSISYIGSVPGFARYHTTVQNMTLGSVTYYKYGQPVTNNIDNKFFNFTHTTSTPGLSTLSVTMSPEYDYVCAKYQDFTSLTFPGLWNIYSKTGMEPQVTFELPPPIKLQNRFVDQSRFVYTGVTGFFSNGTYSYSDMITKALTGVDKYEYEMVTVDVK